MSDDDFDVPDQTVDEFSDGDFLDGEFPDGDDELSVSDQSVPDLPVLDRVLAVRWEAPEPTGVQGVDDAMTPLRELDDLPTAEHVPYYEAVHRQLQDALADLDGA